MSELKARQLKLIEPPRRTIKEIVADGFDERQWVREQKRLKQRQKWQRARKELKAALAAQHNSAITSSKAPQSAKLPSKSKAAGGSQ